MRPTITLTKHHGLGNDFLVVFTDQPRPARSRSWSELAQLWCERRQGIGADGLLVASAPTDGGADLGMALYNADGSEAEMSGNGIRCLGQALAAARDDHEATYLLATDGGLRELVVHDDGRRSA